MDRRRFLLTAGAGMAGAVTMSNVAGLGEARAAGEVPPSYRVPSYRDLYGGKWEELVAKGSTDSLYGRKILRPEDFKHYTVTTRDPRGYDVKFHYVREGSGEPLFLFHGWPGFWWDYWMNIKELSKHFDVIAVDMRGYGDTDKPGYNPKTNRIDLDPVDHYDLNTTVDDHMRVAKALGIEKAYWLGHDWASLTMHKFVRRYPEMVKKLVLANPFLPGAEARYLSPAFHGHSYYASFHSTPLATELVGSSREATKIYFRWFFNWWSYNKTLWTPENPTEDEKRYLAEQAHWMKEEVGYIWIQGTKPQTLAYALTDSPAGLAAWIVEKFHTWSDHGGDLDGYIGKRRPAYQHHALLARPARSVHRSGRITRACTGPWPMPEGARIGVRWVTRSFRKRS